MIKSKTLNIILIFLVSAFQLNAQKLKYKDIYGLLSTKQYEQAEPFLKAYLNDNTDNPNAYLYMGFIYQEKSILTDVLIQTERSINQMDSAVIYLTKASETITEKEIKKNKEYYTAYNRRDLRTGEFGVKLSDVQLDLENRIASLRERIDKVKMVKHYFSNAEDLYKRSYYLFKEIQKTFPGEREMYLRADEAMLGKIKALSLRFDSCTKMFEHYKVSMSNIGKTRYNQSWNLREISDFKNDGGEMTDFYADDVKVWDYKKFATNTLNVIEKEVNPTLADLITYDMEINKLRQRLETDSVSVKNDLVKLVDKLLSNQLKKFDTDPMPMNVFALKIADLEYKSTVIENIPVMKSDNIKGRLNAVTNEAQYIGKVDSVALKLSKRSLDEDILNYNQFIASTFNKGDILKSYIRSLKEYAEREMNKKNKQISMYSESLKWLIVNNDSIPLTTDQHDLKFRPILVENDKYTVGATFRATASGTAYFYNITPSRIPTIKAIFPLDTAFANVQMKNSLQALVTNDPAEQIFFAAVHSSNGNGKFVIIYKSDGLSWTSSTILDFVPIKIELIQATGELLIKSETDSIYVSIDKNGKLIPK